MTVRPATPYSPHALAIELFLVQGNPRYERLIADKYLQHWQGGFFYQFDLRSMQAAKDVLREAGLSAHAKAVKRFTTDPIYNELTMARHYAERGEVTMTQYFVNCARRGVQQTGKFLSPSVLERITQRSETVAAWKATTTKAVPQPKVRSAKENYKDSCYHELVMEEEGSVIHEGWTEDAHIRTLSLTAMITSSIKAKEEKRRESAERKKAEKRWLRIIKRVLPDEE
ncbi:hypothetical protein KY362_05650 [Candidatus Woesearchaeota archaeon]|nr:hypothetical protein [Candidatus Woesearchaeota archaeon]